MNTTNLFVELVVIGVGALAWLLLVVFAVFGWAWVPVEAAFSSTALVPLLGVTYLLGIVTDRLADALFHRLWAVKLLRARFATPDDYHADRHEVLLGSERLAALIEYGRSRLRICRGWTLNALLIAGALNLLVWMRLPETAKALRIALFGTITAVLLAAACAYAWYKLSATEYRKVHEQAALLRRRATRPEAS